MKADRHGRRPVLPMGASKPPAALCLRRRDPRRRHRPQLWPNQKNEGVTTAKPTAEHRRRLDIGDDMDVFSRRPWNWVVSSQFGSTSHAVTRSCGSASKRAVWRTDRPAAPLQPSEGLKRPEVLVKPGRVGGHTGLAIRVTRVAWPSRYANRPFCAE